ncbi:MAG: MGMT family protein [Candidatus Latescibacterota bacterium]|nr:MGMT family protein [Candidatus Latescibacterota bacterium]
MRALRSRHAAYQRCVASYSPHPEGQGFIAHFMRYFMGKSADFDLPLPHVECLTYGDLSVIRSDNIGNGALRRPPPIVLPCYRFVTFTETLIGYSAGPHGKKALLEHEEVAIVNKVTPLPE